MNEAEKRANAVLDSLDAAVRRAAALARHVATVTAERDTLREQLDAALLERDEARDVKAVRVYIDAADRLATAVRDVPFPALTYEQSYGQNTKWIYGLGAALADYDAAKRIGAARKKQ